MMRHVAAMIAVAILPFPAFAQQVSASFAPALDREIRYEVTETRERQGIALAFMLDQRVRFVRDGAGYRMTVTMRSAHAEAPAAIAKRFDAAFRPFVGLEITLLLSDQGKPIGLADEAGTWNRLLAAIEALRADKTLAHGTADGIEAVLAGIAAMPPDARAAKLMENPLRLIGYALPPMAPGDSVANGDARDSASVTLKASDAQTLLYAVRTLKQLPGSAVLTGEGELAVERGTGLLRTSTTREWVTANGAAASEKPDTIITVRLAR